MTQEEIKKAADEVFKLHSFGYFKTGGRNHSKILVETKHAIITVKREIELIELLAIGIDNTTTLGYNIGIRWNNKMAILSHLESRLSK